MTFNERINKISRYNAPMASKIIALRKKYHKLYELSFDRFEELFVQEAARGVKDGDFKSRKQMLEIYKGKIGSVWKRLSRTFCLRTSML